MMLLILTKQIEVLDFSVYLLNKKATYLPKSDYNANGLK